MRLGYGASELEMDSDFGKYGRVEFMLQKRIQALDEAKKLARSLGMFLEAFCFLPSNFFFRGDR